MKYNKKHEALIKPSDEHLKWQICWANKMTIVFGVIGSIFAVFAESQVGNYFFMLAIFMFMSMKQAKIRLEIRDLPNQIILEVQGKCLKKKKRKNTK